MAFGINAQKLLNATNKAKEKHPVFCDSPYHAVSLLTEEVGEFAQAVNDGDMDKAEKELYDVLAVINRYLEVHNQWAT